MPFGTEFLRLTIKEGAKHRFLISLAIDPPPTKTEMGQLFVLIEITKKWFLTTQIGQSIIGILSRSYFKASSTSDLQNFEYAISQVNRLLSSLIEQGETEWVGHLHSAILLVNHEMIHVATTGEMPVWLLRENHFTIITEPLDPTTTPPSKVFGAITSGTLAEKDILFVGSPEIHEEISKNDLKHWLQANSLYEAGLTIAKELKKRKLQETVALLIKRSDTEQTVPNPKSNVIYLDQPIEPIYTQLKRTLAVFGRKANQSRITLSQSIKKKIRLTPNTESFKVISRKFHDFLTGLVNRRKPSVQTKTPMQSSDEHASEPALANESTIVQKPIAGQSIFNIHDYRMNKRLTRKLDVTRFIPYRILTSLTRQRISSLRLAQATIMSKSFMPLAGAILLGAFLITSVAWQKNQINHRKTKRANEQLLSDAKKRIEDGKNALIFNNRKEAQLAFAAAVEQAQSLTKDESFSNSAHELLTQAQQELDTLIGTTRLKDLTQIASHESLFWVAVYDGRLLTMQRNRPEIFEQNPIEPEPTIFASLSNVPLPIQPLITDNLLYVITQTTIEQINLINRQITVFTENPQLELSAVVDLQQFSNNLYALAPSLNKIAKLPLEKENLGRITNYLKKGDIKNAVSLAIDGAIYILRQDGQVTKLSRGEKQEFSLGDLPKPNNTIKKPLQIDTSESIASLFVVDANPDEPRIIEFDKNGKYLHQFILPVDKGELKSVFYQLKARKAWVVLGDGVFEVNL